MAITPDGWLTWAVRVPGPADKVYSQPNSAEMYLPHSAVGFLPAWLNRLRSQDRLPNGRYTDYAAASIHGWIPYDGKVIQHYPFTASCWGSGSRYPNVHGIAFENEGGAPGNLNEPLRPAQVTANVAIIRELIDWKGWTPSRPTGPRDEGASLYEHNECTRWGSGATACPSDRIPWPEILRRTTLASDPKALLALTRLFIEAADDASNGRPLTPALATKIHYILHLSGSGHG